MARRQHAESASAVDGNLQFSDGDLRDLAVNRTLTAALRRHLKFPPSASHRISAVMLRECVAAAIRAVLAPNWPEGIILPAKLLIGVVLTCARPPLAP